MSSKTIKRWITINGNHIPVYENGTLGGVAEKMGIKTVEDVEGYEGMDNPDPAAHLSKKKETPDHYALTKSVNDIEKRLIAAERAGDEEAEEKIRDEMDELWKEVDHNENISDIEKNHLESRLRNISDGKYSKMAQHESDISKRIANGEYDHEVGNTVNELQDRLKQHGLELESADLHDMRASSGFNDEKVTMYDKDGNEYEGTYNKYSDGGREIVDIKKKEADGGEKDRLEVYKEQLADVQDQLDNAPKSKALRDEKAIAELEQKKAELESYIERDSDKIKGNWDKAPEPTDKHDAALMKTMDSLQESGKATTDNAEVASQYRLNDNFAVKDNGDGTYDISKKEEGPKASLGTVSGIKRLDDGTIDVRHMDRPKNIPGYKDLDKYEKESVARLYNAKNGGIRAEFPAMEKQIEELSTSTDRRATEASLRRQFNANLEIVRDTASELDGPVADYLNKQADDYERRFNEALSNRSSSSTSSKSIKIGDKEVGVSKTKGTSSKSFATANTEKYDGQKAPDFVPRVSGKGNEQVKIGNQEYHTEPLIGGYDKRHKGEYVEGHTYVPHNNLDAKSFFVDNDGGIWSSGSKYLTHNALKEQLLDAGVKASQLSGKSTEELRKMMLSMFKNGR